MKSESKPLTREDRIEPFEKKQAANTHRSGAGGRLQLAISSKRRINSVTFDITPFGEDRYESSLNTSRRDRPITSLRRMSAPELPPILDRAKNSPTQLILQGSLNRRLSYSKTSSSHQHSNASDGSVRGKLAKSPQSGVSSSSGQSNGQQNGQLQNGNRLVNGHKLPRGKTWCVPEQTDTALNNKLESIKTNSNMNGLTTPRSTNGYRSRISSKDSSGNNNMTPAKKPLTHCKSDSKIAPEFHKSRTFVKRKDMVKVENGRNNQKNIVSIESKEPFTRTKYNTGNLNGMRKYSSTFVLNTNKTTDNYYEELEDDSDSDSTKDQYIIDWIIGVESEEVDIPPEQELEYVDVPPQTDTAVHIVYGES